MPVLNFCTSVIFAESQDDDEKPKFDKQELDWEKDMELKSKFINRKVYSLTAYHYVIST